MKNIIYNILFLLFLFPVNSFAENIIIESDSKNESINELNIKDTAVNKNSNVDRPSNYKSNNKNVVVQNSNSNYTNKYNSKYNVKKRHYTTKDTRYNNYYTKHTYYVHRRPAHNYSTVIMYQEPQYIEYVEPAEYQESSDVINTNSVVVNESKKNFGIGIHGVIATNSANGNLDGHSSGGFGYYIKYRPARFLSVEFTNDFLFGDLIYTDKDIDQSYTKIPLSLGFRFHFMDYNDFDVYASIAGTLSSIKYHNNYSRDPHFVNTGYQHGGQFGLGFSYIIDYFELGFDVRYTIESVPNLIPYYISNEEDKIIHGAIFTLNVGLII